ncbi:MAG: TFIIB-type zinc ribbon-containing protein, partial [Haloarculaceae archaeon]
MTRSSSQRERERISSSEAETEGSTRETEQETGERACPECESESLIQSSDRGELICEDCGLVVEEGNIDPGPEWRAFNHEERQEKSRVGAPTTQTM